MHKLYFYSNLPGSTIHVHLFCNQVRYCQRTVLIKIIIWHEKCVCMLQVKEECSISLNVTETECLDRFSERKDSGTEFQNGTFVMDSQTEDFYRDPRYPTWCLGDFSRHHINLFMYADNA